MRALATIAVIAAAVGAGVALGTRDDDGRVLRAEFRTVRGLVPGNDVRVSGAIAGSVQSIALTDHGTARVTMRLHDGLPAIRRDASAAIRPVDLLGDTYVDLSPGTDPEPLHGTLGTARTSSAPRLDEVLDTFTPPVRQGMQALFVESGLALDGAGADLSRATVELRPALEATDGVMRELGSQNAALRRLVADAERTTGQLASRDRDLGGLVSGLAGTVRVTAARRADLDRTLTGLPATLTRAGTTAQALRGTAVAALPLARELNAAAPGLTEAVLQARPFLRQLRPAATELRPAVRTLTGTLVTAAPTLRSLRDALARLRAITPETEALLAAVEPAAGNIAKGFFENFADEAAEPGTQPFDPFADPRRNYWRGAAVLSCEAFGVPVKPGCLSDFLKTDDAPSERRASTPAPAGPAPHATPAAPPATPAPSAPAAPAAPVPAAPAAPSPSIPVVGNLPEPVRKPVEQTEQATKDVLNVLLGK